MIFTLDFSEILSIGLGVSNMFQNDAEFRIQQRYNQNQFKIYKSQRDLNKQISAYNLSTSFAAANRQASAVEAAFAAAGFSGGDIQKEANIYRKNLYLGALTGG